MKRYRKPSSGVRYHDFLGEFQLDRNGHKIRPTTGFFVKLAREAMAQGEFNRWSKAYTDLIISWNEIPITAKIKRGDLVLYRKNDKIPNIHSNYYPSIPFFLIAAYVDKVDSVVKENGRIVSVTVTETRWTSFREPYEALRAFKGKSGNTDKAIRQLKKVGYLRDEKMVIPIADIRLIDDINKFLTEKHHLSLPCMPQGKEPFHPS